MFVVSNDSRDLSDSRAQSCAPAKSGGVLSGRALDAPRPSQKSADQPKKMPLDNDPLTGRVLSLLSKLLKISDLLVQRPTGGNRNLIKIN